MTTDEIHVTFFLGIADAKSLSSIHSSIHYKRFLTCLHCSQSATHCAGLLLCRHVLVVMGFFAFFNCYTLRVNLSVAIVAMVNTTYLRQFDTATIQHTNTTNSSSSISRHRVDDVCAKDDNTTNVVDNTV